VIYKFIGKYYTLNNIIEKISILYQVLKYVKYRKLNGKHLS